MHLYAVKFSREATDGEARDMMQEMMLRYPCEYSGGCRIVPWLFDSSRGEMLVAVINIDDTPNYARANQTVLDELTDCAQALDAPLPVENFSFERALNADEIERGWILVDTHRADALFNPRIFEKMANLNFHRVNVERVLQGIVLKKYDFLKNGGGVQSTGDSFMSTDNGKPEIYGKPVFDDLSRIPKFKNLDAPDSEPETAPKSTSAADDVPPAESAAEQATAQTVTEDVPATQSRASENSEPETPEKPLQPRPFGARRARIGGDAQSDIKLRVEKSMKARAMEHPILVAEAKFVREMYRISAAQNRKLPVFSYLADTGRGEYTQLIAQCLMQIVDEARAASPSPIQPFNTTHFKSKSERFTEGQVDYEALKTQLYGKHFCLTDADMLTGMSQRDFDGFTAFLKPYSDTNMVFCGDLDPMSPLLKSRWSEIDAMLNVRRIDSRHFALDECELLSQTFGEEGLDAGEVLAENWQRYRRLRGGADICQSMRHFAGRTLFAHYENLAANPSADCNRVTPEDFSWITYAGEIPLPGDSDTPQALTELKSMIGLGKVKRTVSNMIAHSLMSLRKEKAGLGAARPAYTFLMLGSPGTGKTTVAMLLGRIFRELGLLRSGHVITAGRADLVGAFLGHTALKTTELFNSALGGVLFVDEAYSIVSGDHADSYGHEVLSTFAQLMTEHVGEICVIFAGYDRPMQNMLDANPGLRHRFAYTLNFEDYSQEEMRAIFDLKAAQRHVKFEDGCLESVYALLNRVTRAKTDNFANGRVVDNLLQYIIEAQENRLAEVCRAGDEPTAAQLALITASDCKLAFDSDAIKALSKDGRRRVGF